MPELKEGDPNDFLTKLFEKVRANLAAESATVSAEKKQYDEAMTMAKVIVKGVNEVEDIQDAVKGINELKHALTSQKEAKALLKSRLDELGIVWNKAAKKYESKG